MSRVSLRICSAIDYDAVPLRADLVAYREATMAEAETSTAGWRARLAKLVQAVERLPHPLTDCVPHPPSGGPWPQGMPSCSVLRDFYELCDGGYVRHLRWCRLRELKARTKEAATWIGQHGPEESPFDPRRHVLLGEDEAGFPFIWDSTVDQIAYYQPYEHGGNGWEPLHETLEQFLQRLFYPGEADYPAEWLEAIRLSEELA